MPLRVASRENIRRPSHGELMPLPRLPAKNWSVRRRPITTEAIGSAATHPSLRGALATKQSRGHNMRGASNPDGRTAAPGLLRFANKKQTVTTLILLEKLCTEKERGRHGF